MFLPFDDSVASKGVSSNHSAMKRKLYMVISIFLNSTFLHTMRELSPSLKMIRLGEVLQGLK